MRKLEKMIILFAASLFFLISFGPTSADAELYKYIDKKGTIHFTDSYESIPQEYREQIKVIKEPSRPSTKPAEMEEGKRKGAPTEGQAEKEIKEIEELKKKEAELKAAQEKEAREREVLETKLKARQEKERQIEELRRQIEAKQSEQRTLYSNPLMVRDRNQFLQLNQEINELYQQVQVLQSQLDAEQ
jgi:hypothetical protein